MNKPSIFYTPIANTVTHLVHAATGEHLSWQGTHSYQANAYQTKPNHPANQPIGYAKLFDKPKLFDKQNVNQKHYPDQSDLKSRDEQISASRYEKNRKLLAKIFIVWSVALVLLLLNVFDIL